MNRILAAALSVFFLLTTAQAAEVEVLKPKGNLEVKLGHPSSISLYDMPAILTRERLNQNGWNVSSVEFTRTDPRNPQHNQPVTDGDLARVVDNQIKQRRESIELFQKGNRKDLVEKEQAERWVDYLSDRYVRPLGGHLESLRDRVEDLGDSFEVVVGSGTTRSVRRARSKYENAPSMRSNPRCSGLAARRVPACFYHTLRSRAMFMQPR